MDQFRTANKGRKHLVRALPAAQGAPEMAAAPEAKTLRKSA